MIRVIDNTAEISGSVKQVMEDLAKAVRCSKTSMLEAGIPERFADVFINDAVNVGLDIHTDTDKKNAERVVAEIMTSYSRILRDTFGK